MTDLAAAPQSTSEHGATPEQGPFESDPILVEVVRNGTIESVHHGRVAVTGPDGRLVRSLGAALAPM